MIEKYAFRNCTSLRNIYLLSETPPFVGSDNFSESQYANTMLNVPVGTLEKYQVADTWKNFVNIQELDATAIGNVDADDISIEVTVNGISILGAEGKMVVIYSINGTLVKKTENYKGEDIVLDNGDYIIRAGNKTIKAKL